MNERTIQTNSAPTISVSRRGALRFLTDLALTSPGLVALPTSDGDAFGLWIDSAPIIWIGDGASHVYDRGIEGKGRKPALHLPTEPSSSLNQRTSLRRIIATPVEFNLSDELTAEIRCG